MWVEVYVCVCEILSLLSKGIMNVGVLITCFKFTVREGAYEGAVRRPTGGG